MSGMRSIGRGACLAFGVIVGAGAGGAASAGTLDLPAAKPVIRLDVPEGWTRETSESGVELTAPDGKSVVLVGVVERDRAKVEAWETKALGRVKAFGVVFDDKAKSPPPPAPAPVVKGMDFAAKDGAFTFSGPPSLSIPGGGAPKDGSPQSLGGLSFESLTDPNFEVSNKPKFKVVQYVGTTLDKKPVDVQFGLYTLPDRRFFVVMQESAPDDSRAVAIAKSVRPIK